MGLFPEKGSLGSAIKLICGLFFTVVMIGPWNDFVITDYEPYWQSVITQGNLYVADGEDVYNEHLASGIKERTESYILDKASKYNPQWKIQVELDDSAPPVPEIVTITGAATPLQKKTFGAELAEELGIHKENILWLHNG